MRGQSFAASENGPPATTPVPRRKGEGRVIPAKGKVI
jgi:hypothetical protein